MAEFTVNNKIYLAIKISPFMVNYGKELRMRADIRRKGKVEKIMEFIERMKKVATMKTCYMKDSHYGR